jgi:succinate dehydrogenase/fumarate reductase-like Fe-S protein
MEQGQNKPKKISKKTETRNKMTQFQTCIECSRVFDLLYEIDAEEFYYGHDCEN